LSGRRFPDGGPNRNSLLPNEQKLSVGPHRGDDHGRFTMNDCPSFRPRPTWRLDHLCRNLKMFICEVFLARFSLPAIPVLHYIARSHAGRLVREDPKAND
jgi:hypothetical protein